jgi:catalase
VQTPAIRHRVVASIRNVDDELARHVADGLGLDDLPDPLEPERTPIDVETSRALSMLANPLESFRGRKLGVLVSRGADAKTLRMLRLAAEAEGMTFAVVAPTVEGVADSEGKAIEVAEKIDGGPSVLFDAVAVVLASAHADEIAVHSGAKDFVSDAHAHKKFVAYNDAALTVFESANVNIEDAPGYHRLDGSSKTADAFIATCREVRAWDRQI